MRELLDAENNTNAEPLVALDETLVDAARVSVLIPAMVKSFKSSVLSVSVFYALLVHSVPVGLTLWLGLRIVVTVLCLKRIEIVRKRQRDATDQIRSLAVVMGVSGITWGLLPLFAHPEPTQWRAVVALWIFGNQSVITAVCSPAKSVFVAAVGSVTLTAAITMASFGESFNVVLAFIIVLGGVYSLSLFEAMNLSAVSALKGRLIAQELAATLRVRQEALSIANEDLARLVNEDVLTPTLNRRGFIDATAADGQHVDVAGWIGIIDVDRFKAINDTHGHQAGDQVLVVCAKRWQKLLPAPMLLARMGGDEFAVSFPACSEEKALAIADRLLDAAKNPLAIRPGTTVHVSCSIGLMAVAAGDSLSAVIGRADAALYVSKQSQRPSVATA